MQKNTRVARKPESTIWQLKLECESKPEGFVQGEQSRRRSRGKLNGIAPEDSLSVPAVWRNRHSNRHSKRHSKRQAEASRSQPPGYWIGPSPRVPSPGGSERSEPCAGSFSVSERLMRSDRRKERSFRVKGPSAPSSIRASGAHQSPVRECSSQRPRYSQTPTPTRESLRQASG